MTKKKSKEINFSWNASIIKLATLRKNSNIKGQNLSSKKIVHDDTNSY